MEASVLTPEERLERFDHELESVKRAFLDAVEQIRQVPEIDGSLEERLATVGERLGKLRRLLEPADFDKEQLNELHNTLWEIHELLRNETFALDICDALLVAIERIRHILRDALDEYVTGVRDDVGLVLQDLRKWLPTTPMRVIADLVGVDRRTLSRWAKQSGPPPRRLALVARLVAILQHNWSEEGIVAWFTRPRRDLGGKRPVSFLDDPNQEEALLGAARSGRSLYAT